MGNQKSRLSQLIEYKSFSVTPKIKKMIATSFIATALLLSAGVAKAEEKLTTVYYVYLNDKFLGKVSDKKVVDQMIKDKLAKAKQTYKNFHLTAGSQITYVQEQAFHSSANNEAVLKKLEKELNVKAEAAAIVINGKPVAFVENDQAAKDVLTKMKQKYVPQAQLKALEARKENPEKTLPPLKENEARILDVRLSENVSFSKENVFPKSILSVENAVKLLEKGTLEEKKYKVKDGDVLGSIANAHGLETAQLLALNPGLKADSVIHLGQELNVTAYKPYLQVIVDKEVNAKEVMHYETQTVESDSMFKGDTKVQQQGKDGLRTVTYAISEQNGRAFKKEVRSEQVLQAPVKHIIVKGIKVIPSRGDGSFSFPTNGGYISSEMGYRWGKLHKGIDIARPSDYTIKAADNGIVTSAGWDGGYGNKIVIDHQNGYVTVYAHLDSISVSAGQTVPKGTAIGVMGSTGDSTGTHLHFEVYKNGSLVDPRSVLN